MGNTSIKPISSDTFISTLRELKSRDKEFNLAFSKAFDNWIQDLQSSTNVKLLRSSYFYKYIESIYADKFNAMELNEEEKKYLRKIMKKVWKDKIKKGIIEPVTNKPGSFTF